LFALGVILFILKAGYQPFKVANVMDEHYKLLAMNRSDLFWAEHSKYFTTGFFTEEFKSLVTSLLQMDPCHRLGIMDIVAHPWIVNTAMATEAEAREEFSRRALKSK
jgi:serine/threonine protein kinase